MTTLREAAQMALEALEYPGPSWLESRQKAAEAIRAALAQPEQERDRGGACVVLNGTSGVFTIPLPGPTGGGGVSAAPAQPKREWQGLTDEERQECLFSDPIFGMAASTFARAVEARLREKNT